jgi:hypothetical protein
MRSEVSAVQRSGANDPSTLAFPSPTKIVLETLVESPLISVPCCIGLVIRKSYLHISNTKEGVKNSLATEIVFD